MGYTDKSREVEFVGEGREVHEKLFEVFSLSYTDEYPDEIAERYAPMAELVSERIGFVQKFLLTSKRPQRQHTYISFATAS